MGNMFTESGVLRCGAADPASQNTERTGRAVRCASEVMKPCICWRHPYLLPSSFLAEEILSQYEKEG